jgi:hypothetical protein
MGRTVIRLRASIGKHTYVYSYPPEEAAGMVDIILDDVIRCKIPVLAGRVLTEMVLGGMADDD